MKGDEERLESSSAALLLPVGIEVKEKEPRLSALALFPCYIISHSYLYLYLVFKRHTAHGVAGQPQPSQGVEVA